MCAESKLARFRFRPVALGKMEEVVPLNQATSGSNSDTGYGEADALAGNGSTSSPSSLGRPHEVCFGLLCTRIEYRSLAK